MEGLGQTLHYMESSNYASIKLTKFTTFFEQKFHYRSFVRSWICKQYSTADSRLLRVETMPHPTRSESGGSKLVSFSLNAYN